MKTTVSPPLFSRISGTKAGSVLFLLALLSACIYGLITWLSFRFQVDTQSVNLPEQERPIVAVLLLFATAFLLYCFAIRVVNRAKDRSGLMLIIFGAAILFRGIVWFSTPIQEVDIYRYIWDGVVASQGISPFRFSPQEVINADGQPTSDADLEHLVWICRNDPGIAESLRRVHFRHLPTVYPPVSQVVFTIAAKTTPAGSSTLGRLRIMKLWLLLFDLGTLWMVVQLLLLCRLPPELSIAYAWCPLLMKEVANSGHLDSITVFLATCAFYVFVKTVQTVSSNPARTPTKGLLIAANLLALAVGAKIYPIVLVPLFAWVVYRRFGWTAVLAPAISFAVLSILLLFPFMPQSGNEGGSDPSEGMSMFLRSWEINDLLFMLVIENLKPIEDGVTTPVWFSVLPAEAREKITGVCASWEVPYAERPFFVTRLLTGVIFLGVAIGLAVRSTDSAGVTHNGVETFDPQRSLRLCQTAFLTIAWFWLLCPTQNPWYWTWVLPFLPFMRNRAWFAVSGLVFLYYTRFWFEYHLTGVEVMGTGYTGTFFFDFVVVCLEFAPWFVWLAISGWIMSRQSDGSWMSPLRSETA